MISGIFIFLAIMAIVMLVVGLIKPDVLKDKKTGEIPSRKNIATGSIALLIVSIIVAGIFSVPDKTPDQIAKDDSACKLDLQCLGDKASMSAGIYCGPEIERLAKFTYRWTDGTLEPKFSHFRWKDKASGILTMIGDKIEFQNGFGAYMNHIYECDYDQDSHSVLAVRAAPGRLPK